MLKYLFARKMLSIFAISGLLLMPLAVTAGGFESQLLLGNQALYLNGEGPRKKAFLPIYDTALYLTEKGSDAAAIIAADHPMAIALIVRSRFATASRISEAFREGLEKSSGGDTQAIEAQIDRFLAVFDNGVVKEDRYKFIYIPGSGLDIYKNGEVLTQIKGLDFKQALYGIWLSENPVSTTLKSQLLGK
jgi:hypothetical protein